MAFVVLHRDARLAVLNEGGHVPAAEAGLVCEAAALLAEARAVAAAAAANAEAAAETARAEGRAEGLEQGRGEAEAELGARLFALEAKAAEARIAERERTVELALAIVARIADGLGDGPVVAALAARAAADLMPGAQAVIRVPPAALAMARARLGADARLVGDPSLGPRDCVIDTPLGRTLAGLDVQLAAIGRNLAEEAEASEEGSEAPGEARP